MIITEMYKKIKEEPLTFIDDFIVNKNNIYAKYEENIYENGLTDFLCALLEVIGFDYDIDTVRNDVFDKQISELNQKFIAISLLRLLTNSDIFFPKNDVFRNKTFQLFDKVFEKNIYMQKDVMLTQKSQGFEKENKLKQYLVNIEKSIKEQLDQVNIDQITQFKGMLYKCLSTQINRMLMHNFVSESILDKTRYNDLFQNIEQYFECTDEKKAVRYSQTIMIFDSILIEMQNCNTIYCNDFFGDSFNKLYNQFVDDFEACPYSKPAELKIEKTSKKYPFNMIDSNFIVGFRIINDGLGFAHNASIEIIDYSKGLDFINKSASLGSIQKTSVLYNFRCNNMEEIEKAFVQVKISWFNFDNIKCSKYFNFELESQNSHVNWELKRYEDPYSWEPVETEDKLVGRKEIVDKLWTSIIKKDKVSSFYIHGQKRVGKTSIVKTLKSKVEADSQNECLCFYIEGGEYKGLTLEKTISNLGEMICKKIKNSRREFQFLEIPNFDGALSPLTYFLDTVELINSKIRILIILDEFDEISRDIFSRSEVSDALFLTLRAISNKNKFGFLLVGGEKMNFVISCQGEQLNKFQSIRVDYFDKENYFNDFKELATKPVEGILEFTEEALIELYNQTAGNPFFTVVVCIKLFYRMCELRDAHVTEYEIKNVIGDVIKESDTQIFAHFWEDGIKGKDIEEEEISIIRRKILISMASVLSKHEKAEESRILDECIKNGLSETISSDYLKEFVERQVFIKNNDLYTFKISIFKEWLVYKGVNSIITTFSDKDRVTQEKLLEEKAMIKAEEIMELVIKWNDFSYCGSRISSDQIRAWLNQFGENQKQRIAFKILQETKLYSDFEIRMKVRELYKYILTVDSENLKHVIEGKTNKIRKRNDFLVSYLEDNISKSGTEYAKLFTEENNILASNSVEKNRIESIVCKSDTNIKAVFFIDDFVGTGNSISSNFQNLLKEYPLLAKSKIKFYILVIAGFATGKDKILENNEKNNIDLLVHIADILTDNDKCFDDSSKIFQNMHDRQFAKSVCYEYGTTLVNNSPFGYGDCQATVVFSKTCPNDSLPILWARNKNFKPLFERKL